MTVHFDPCRHVSNGEILGVSLLMEDVLTMGHQDRAIVMEDGESQGSDDVISALPGVTPMARPMSQLSRAPSSRPASSTDYGRRGQ